MKLKLSILLIFSLCILSCKTNFCGKQLEYFESNSNNFKMNFINDSIIEINQESNTKTIEKAIYKYHILEKDALETTKKNQPTVNFKTKKQHGQFYQNIAIEKIKGNNANFKQQDTLIYLKMRIENKITKRIYFDGGNKFIEL